MSETFQGDRSPVAGSHPDPAQSAKEMIGAAADTLKDQATQVASVAKDKARDTLQDGQAAAGQAIGQFAAAIRKAGDDLAQHDQSMVGRAVKQAADGLETLSRALAEKHPEDLMRTVQDFGRANPVAFVAGTVLVGVALGRFARSSRRHLEPDTPRVGARPTDTLRAANSGATPPIDERTAYGVEVAEPASYRGDWASAGAPADRFNEPGV